MEKVLFLMYKKILKGISIVKIKNIGTYNNNIG
jgi:hypothetical protein